MVVAFPAQWEVGDPSFPWVPSWAVACPSSSCPEAYPAEAFQVVVDPPYWAVEWPHHPVWVVLRQRDSV